MSKHPVAGHHGEAGKDIGLDSVAETGVGGIEGEGLDPGVRPAAANGLDHRVLDRGISQVSPARRREQTNPRTLWHRRIVEHGVLARHCLQPGIQERKFFHWNLVDGINGTNTARIGPAHSPLSHPRLKSHPAPFRAWEWVTLFCQAPPRARSCWRSRRSRLCGPPVGLFPTETGLEFSSASG